MNTETMKVGFVGLGKMGKPMAKNLLKHHYALVAYDRDKHAMEEIKHLGATIANSTRDVGCACKIAFMMLPMCPPYDALEIEVFGPGGITTTMTPGSVVIDCGNTQPAMTTKLAQECMKRNINFLSAPVTGGMKGAEKGELVIFVGGDEKVFKGIKPVLDAIGSSIYYVGMDPSLAQTAKTLNNTLVSINLAGVTEVLILAAKAGIDPVPFLEVMGNGAAASYVLETYGKNLARRLLVPPDSPERKSQADGEIPHPRDKNIEWTLEAATAMDVPTIVTAAVWGVFKLAKQAGKIGHFSPLCDYLEEMCEVRLYNTHGKK
jgi:2-hydroxy-3-oxopropionate reductase